MVAAIPETAEDYEEYKEAVAMLPRSKLEEFALEAAQTMENLEQENDQLKTDIDDVKKIDVDVIDGWRRWSQTLDTEREKWADLATKMSAEKELLNDRYRRATATIEALLRVIGDLEITATDHSQEGTKALQLRAGYKKILKMTHEAVDKYSKIDEDSEAEPFAEDFSDESS